MASFQVGRLSWDFWAGCATREEREIGAGKNIHNKKCNQRDQASDSQQFEYYVSRRTWRQVCLLSGWCSEKQNILSKIFKIVYYVNK